ncbi:MAG TPA: LysR family transcriptional regulator, partial [Thermomicrobiales bacterium]|nr:LysR family transcriptional regulator [Thermomicrobiales bacterium]
MELRQLRYFVAVARRRHYTAAAEEIGVAQPALSQQIKLLERELGLDLFDRTGRRVRLTAAGEALLVRAERILADVASAEQEMAEFAGLARGRVIVGTLPSLAERQLPGLLAGFHARHPGLDLVLREESTVRLLALAGSGDVDLALINELPAADLPAGITTEPLFSEE